MNNKKSSLFLDYVIAILAYLIMATSMVFINYPKFDRTCKKVAHQIFKVAEKYDAILEINANLTFFEKIKQTGLFYRY